MTAVRKVENVIGKILEIVPASKVDVERVNGVKESFVVTATSSANKILTVKAFARKTLLVEITFPVSYVISNLALILIIVNLFIRRKNGCKCWEKKPPSCDLSSAEFCKKKGGDECLPGYVCPNSSKKIGFCGKECICCRYEH